MRSTMAMTVIWILLAFLLVSGCGGKPDVNPVSTPIVVGPAATQTPARTGVPNQPTPGFVPGIKP
jgi:outer membrane murein-binding lipoprotein Lpp